MKALLLAAGLGTRLRPVTDTIPKCLVPIHGTPLLGIWLKMLTEAGIDSMLVNLHYLPEKVQAYLDETPYREMVQAVYEEELLGTAGTLLKNRDFFDDAPLLLIHADNLSFFDVRAFIQSHLNRPSGCEITMMTFETDTPQSCGILELSEEGIVRAFHEKVPNPPGNLANGAVYIVEPSLFGFLEGLHRDVIDFSTEVIPNYLGRIYTFKNETYHRDIGTLSTYQAALNETVAFEFTGSRLSDWGKALKV